MWHSFSKGTDFPKALKALSPPDWWVTSTGANTLAVLWSSEFIFLAIRGRKHQAHLSPFLFFKCFKKKNRLFFSLFLHGLCYVTDAVILQQFYHFLPADSAEVKRAAASGVKLLSSSVPVIWSRCYQGGSRASHHTAAFVGVRKTLWWCWCNDDRVSHYTAQCRRLVYFMMDDYVPVDTSFCLIRVEVHSLSFECSRHFEMFRKFPY